MKIVAIVQARVGSTRLPAKVLLDLCGVTVLQRCLERVKQFRGISEVIVATSNKPQDDLIVAVAKRCGVKFYQGDEEDVLMRYTKAAREVRADVVVRCTSDCPLLDPEISSQVIEQFLSSRVDYASNIMERFLPRGLDTEIFSVDALERANQNATKAEEREHVTLAMYKPDSEFVCKQASYENCENLYHHRWTLDTIEDYCFLASVFNRLGSKASTASMCDVLEILKRNPKMALSNAHVEQRKV